MLDVPFLCQRQAGVGEASAVGLPDGTTWADRTCAIACATMVLNYFGRPVSIGRVLDAALAARAFDVRRGWMHSGIVAVLQSFGLTAYRRNWRLLDGREASYLGDRAATPAALDELAIVAAQMVEEGLGTIAHLLTCGIPVIASIYRPWGDRSSVGHQVVLLDMDQRRVSLHDPAQENGAIAVYERDALIANWKGTAIVAHLPGQLSPSRG